MAKPHIDLLIEKGVITKEQADRAREEVSRTGMPIEKALERLGFISEVEVAQTLAEALGIPFMDLTEYLIDPDVLKLVPESVAKKYRAVPLFKIGENLTVAMSDPQDIIALDEIRLKSGIASIEPVLSTPDMIQHVIDQYYGALGSAQELVRGLDKEKPAFAGFETGQRTETAEESPVIKLVNLILIQAIKDRASDVHIEPAQDSVIVRYRVDGILHEAQKIPSHLHPAVCSRIKIMAKMDISETRLPQDGRINLNMENRNLDLRVSSFPTIYGENIVLRLLDKSSVLLGLTELGFSAQDLNDFEKVIRRPNGIILVTGPTGSGKTTTLYSALSAINSSDKNILTIEDPVEYELPMIRQTQVNPKAGLTFANGLRSILRQDPDIIMVGEIRDLETAEIAIQASLTGHLVFSTLHTNDAASALTRLLDMGVEPYLISSSVIAILAQRLVRLICVKCKQQYVVSQDELKDLNLAGDIQLFVGKGCGQCKNTGLTGRIGIFELLVMNDEIKGMVTAKQSAGEIKKKAREAGMRTLFEVGLEKVKEGLITVEELLRVTEEIR
jgi:type IV pilus assembly protein PilB